MRPEPGVVLLLAALLLRGAYPAPLAAAAVALAALWAWRRAPLAPGPAGWWLPWLGWAAICAAASSQPWAALPVVAKWTAYLLVFAAAAGWGEVERRQWLGAALLVVVPLAAAGVWTGVKAGHFASASGLIPRYYGYTAFAVLGGAAAGLGLAAQPSAGRSARIAGAAAALLGAAYLFWVRSRGAELGLLAAAALALWRRAGGKGAAALLGAALGAAVLLPGPARDALLKRDTNYPLGRLGLWRSAAAAASDAPLHGWGPGNLRLGYLRHPAPTGGPVRWTLTTDYAHSEPLQAAVETGWAGLLLWLLGFVAALSSLLRPAREEPAVRAAGTAAAGMAVMLLTDNVLQVPALGFLFFTALGCAAAPDSGWRPTLPRKAFLGLAPLLALGPLAVTVSSDAGASDLRARLWRKSYAAAFYPADPSLREDLAQLYEEGRAPAAAEDQWALAERGAPFNGVYPFRRALLAARRGDWAAAERGFARAAEVEPAFRDARLGRAEALWRLKRPAEARAELAAARAAPDLGPQDYGYSATVGGRSPAVLAHVEALLSR